METIKLSIAEIANLVTENRLSGLPETVRGIQYRADKEDWSYKEVPTQGGKNGLKRIYTLPSYVVEELREKGLLHLLGAPSATRQGAPAKPHRSFPKTPARTGGGIPEFMRPMVAEYDDWAAEQGTDSISSPRATTPTCSAARATAMRSARSCAPKPCGFAARSSMCWA